MIYAKFIESNSEIKRFVLSGHAESGPAGHDLVCAASSALAIGTVNSLYRILSKPPIVDYNEIEGGFLDLLIPLEKLQRKEREYAQILLDSLYYSLLDIQEEHGEYISVSKEKNDQL